MKQRPSRRGFFITEAMAGLSLLGIVALVLSVALVREHTAERQMADVREATRVAEAALLNLRAGLPAPKAAGEVKLEVTPVAGATAVGQYNWVEVTATVRGRVCTLRALAPQEARP